VFKGPVIITAIGFRSPTDRQTEILELRNIQALGMQTLKS